MVTVADTAFSIALVREQEKELPESERLFDDPFAALFREAGAHAADATARFLALPMFREGIRLRTRAIDDAVREGLAAGLQQLVILGAGFDARGMRLPEVAERRVTVFEIDVPEQLERKRRVLEAAGVRLSEAIRYVPFEFETRPVQPALIAELERHGFRTGAGAMFVWEGVIGYIDLPAIDGSLRFMAQAGGRNSRLVFTFAEVAFDPELAADHVVAAGFSTFEEASMADLWRRYGLPGEPPEAAAMVKIGAATV